MNAKRLAGIVILIMAFIVGCSGDYGIVKRQTPTDNKMTLAELKENFENYHIYNSKRGDRRAINILFDPKNDETRVVGDGCYRIADQQALSEKIREIHAWYKNHEVMIIEGPDKRFFGYMYCSWIEDYSSWTPSIYDVKLIDEHTVHVFQGI